MCWGLYLAVPNIEPPRVSVDLRQGPDDDADLTAWRVDNPWIPMVFGDVYRCWIVGHAQYCSCGCVESSDTKEIVTLERRARQYVADIADAAGHVALAIHWISQAHDTEELAFDVSTSITSGRLRRKSAIGFAPDSFCWVQGRTMERY